MNNWFADTFYFLALLVHEDKAHARAVEITSHLRTGIVTTPWVLTEVADGLAAARTRGAFARLLDTLRSNPRVTIVALDESLFDRGIQLYLNRPDKNWSLTDCISFILMEDLGLTEALTGDHHFEQAGFRALLK